MTLLTASTNEIPEHSAWHDLSGAVVTIAVSFLAMLAVNFLLR